MMKLPGGFFTMGLAGLFSFFSTGCYFLQQGTALVGTYMGAKPVTEMLRSKDLTPREREFLIQGLDIRTYALEALGLSQNNNYTTYIQTKKKYLADVVSASADDRFEQYLWQYPLVGELPYKGFFDREQALEEAHRLKKENNDVMVRGVDAFSTLGFFSDPLFSYMVDYTEGELADLIIHEMTHATVFLPGQGDFNENLATFVGRQGSATYLSSKYGPQTSLIQDSINRRADSAVFRKDLLTLREELAALYENKEMTRVQKLAIKSQIIDNFKKEFVLNYSRRYATPAYLGFPKGEINNAMLLTYSNYDSDQDLLEKYFDACGGDISTFIKEVKTIPKEEKTPFQWIESRIQSLNRGAELR